MANITRIGALGLTHDHIWGNLNDLAALPSGTLVAAADPHPELLDKIESEYGCPHVFASAEELLDAVDLDAVFVFGDNASGAEAAIMAAERGLHVMVEKPMAADLDGAVRMLAAARMAGVELMINWPFAWMPALHKALEMAHTGEIGEIFSVKYRAAHCGPKALGCTPYFYNWLYDAELNGAGALMDYCCYGAALTRYLAGMPSRVTGVAGQLQQEYITVEDNAVIVMQSPRAISISEASWTQIGHLTSYVTTIYGSQGTIVVERSSKEHRKGRVTLATHEHDNGIELDVPALPAEMQNGSAYFLHRIQTGQPTEGLCHPRIGRDAQEILEAGLVSAHTGQAVSLPLPL